MAIPESSAPAAAAPTPDGRAMTPPDQDWIDPRAAAPHLADRSNWYEIAPDTRDDGEQSVSHPLITKDRTDWYRIAGKPGPAPARAPTRRELFAVLFQPEQEGPIAFVTLGLVVGTLVAAILAAAFGPPLPAAASGATAITLVSAGGAAIALARRQRSAFAWVLGSQALQGIVAITFAAVGLGAQAVLFAVVIAAVVVSYYRRALPVLAASGAVGLAALVAGIVVAAGLSDRESVKRHQLAAVAVRGDRYSDPAMGVTVIAPPGVWLVPADVPSWVTAALDLDPDEHLIVLVSEDGTLTGYVHAERPSRPAKLSEYALTRLHGFGHPDRADDLLPPTWTDYAETLAFRFSEPARTVKGIVFFARTVDNRYVTVLAFGPAATFASLQPRMIQLASALRVIEPKPTPAR